MDLPRLDPVPPIDPANPLELVSVLTKPAVPIANHDETVSLLPAENEAVTVWDSSVDKTAHPVGFKLDTGPLSARVVARALIPKDWGNDLDCLLTGTVAQGNELITVLSGAWKWTIPQPRSDAPAEPFKFETDVEFLDPLGDSKLAPILPYGFHGQVQWTLELKKTVTTPKLAGMKATSLLEMYRLSGDAPGGPTAAAAVTRINLQGKWPVGLLRSFVPDPFDLAKLSAEDVAALKADLWPWWARHAVGKIQAKKQCYDAAEGRSGYEVGPTGGSFDLQGWIQDSNPNVNSADLTALLQAAFSILTTPQRPDPSNWVLMTPFGEIAAKQIVPYGFDLNDGVPNPFFKGLGAKGDIDTESGKISSFSWLEIKPNDSNPPTVIQTAFKIKSATNGNKFIPDVAQRPRKAFLQSCVKNPEAFPNLGMDDCYTTTDFEPVKADNKGLYLRRVGLYDLRGINEPWQLVTYNRPSLMPMTKKSRFAIKKVLLERGGDEKAALLNDASLLPSVILPILADKPNFKVTPESFNLKVGRGVAVASYTLPTRLKSPTGTPINACVKIHVYETYNDALEAMAFELAKLESMPDKVARPRSSIYGSYMILTTKSLFMVRGNLMVSMAVLGLDRYDDTLPEALLKMADQLYEYLKVRVALPFQARRPSVIVADEWKANSKVVEPRKPFDVAVQLKGEYNVKDTMCVYIASGDGTSSTEQPIIFTGASEPAFGSDRTFSFYSLNKENKQIPGEVHVTIGVAHSETFFPAADTFTVKL
ncbi:hypothetical protein FGADI_3315 [Fusarium gaditjirri]|uniref:Uncharacterized protein n=1 Tax=Fusarium gaditjirri TaxID=282569 RepID=A0A8H4TFR6_9HYPO|nr:hypothetical protein FGADI_3315 [Fusarium gaditjirri]